MIDFELSERLSVTGENALIPFLRQHADMAVTLSCTRLRRLDTRLVQVLVAAAADHRARGSAFRLTGLSAEHSARLALLGVTPAILDCEAAQ